MKTGCEKINLFLKPNNFKTILFNFFSLCFSNCLINGNNHRYRPKTIPKIDTEKSVETIFMTWYIFHLQISIEGEKERKKKQMNGKHKKLIKYYNHILKSNYNFISNIF
jgi:hypothetical protein